MADLAYDDISKLLKADFETGELYWLARDENMFVDTPTRPAKSTCRQWNSRFSGKQAFTSTYSEGYKHGTLLGKSYLAHRVLWLMATGEWPKDDIDHVNGNKSDNRIANLREASNAENRKNQKQHRTNMSGITGVSWYKQTQRWKAQIGVDGRKRHLGYFASFEAAAIARKEAERRFNYHENHGRN